MSDFSIASKALAAPKTGRYFVAGPPPSKADKVLFALHGYGQLPEFFLRHFADVLAAGWTVVAPEGLHRFYIEGTSGRVGASWMTKEDRLTDIADTMEWLDRVRAEVLKDASPTETVLLGFSQGVAAAMRWAALRPEKRWTKLVFWAGVLPPDLDWATSAMQHLQGPPIFTALGSDDPFFDGRIADDASALFEQAGLATSHVAYPGGHRVHSETLLGILGSSSSVL